MFLDTSGLYSLHDVREPTHARAVAAYDQARRRLTHDGILEEFVPLSDRRGARRDAAIQFVLDILNDPEIEVVWADEALHRRAIALLIDRPDKGYSLCDAVSFLVMRERRLTDALTTDHHFEQEGFVRLLR